MGNIKAEYQVSFIDNTEQEIKYSIELRRERKNRTFQRERSQNNNITFASPQCCQITKKQD